MTHSHENEDTDLKVHIGENRPKDAQSNQESRPETEKSHQKLAASTMQ